MMHFTKCDFNYSLYQTKPRSQFFHIRDLFHIGYRTILTGLPSEESKSFFPICTICFKKGLDVNCLWYKVPYVAILVRIACMRVRRGSYSIQGVLFYKSTQNLRRRGYYALKCNVK